jgi:hypothetical protein
MATNATRIAQHRRALWAGIGISVTAHVGALTVFVVPGFGPTEDGGRDAVTVYEDTFDAVEVIELAENTPAVPASIRPSETDAASGAQPTPSVEATSRPSLADRLADLAPASVSVVAPDMGRPVVTFRDLEPVAQTEAMMAAFAYGGGLQDGEEEEGGGWSSFLGGISAALSGGGHCPTPGAGPMILR